MNEIKDILRIIVTPFALVFWLLVSALITFVVFVVVIPFNIIYGLSKLAMGLFIRSREKE